MRNWIAFVDQMPPIGQTVLLQRARLPGEPYLARTSEWDGKALRGIGPNECFIGWAPLHRGTIPPAERRPSALFSLEITDHSPREWFGQRITIYGTPLRFALFRRGTIFEDHPAGGWLLRHPDYPPERLYADDGEFVVEVQTAGCISNHDASVSPSTSLAEPLLCSTNTSK